MLWGKRLSRMVIFPATGQPNGNITEKRGVRLHVFCVQQRGAILRDNCLTGVALSSSSLFQHTVAIRNSTGFYSLSITSERRRPAGLVTLCVVYLLCRKDLPPSPTYCLFYIDSHVSSRNKRYRFTVHIISI